MSLLKKILYVVAVILIAIVINTTISKAKTVEITTETLNLRKEPSTESNIVALISIGDECEVLDEEGDWYKVKYKDYTGYISKEYTKVIGDGSDSTIKNNDVVEEQTNEEKLNNIIDTSEETEEISNSTKENSVNDTTEEEENIAKQGKINKETDVKIVPLINGSKIENLKNNTVVTIVTEINGWTYIQADTISGWVRSNNITIIESSNNDEDKDVIDDNQDEETTEGKEDNLSNNDDNSSFTAKTMYVKEDYINVRKEANTNSERVMVVSQNTELKVIGETGDWYKVNTSEGEAYVLKDLLSEKKITVTNRGSVNRTEDKNDVKEAEDKNTSTSDSSKEDSNSLTGSQIVSYAKNFLGVPYVYGGASTSGFDCSGFTMYVYKHFGISMAHGAQSQAKIGKNVSANKSSKSSLLNNLKSGDLVFFLDYETMDEIGHCGIYIGDGNFIHASSGSGYCVKINSLLPGEYYNTRYCAARRII